MNDKLNKALHKTSSIFAVLAVLATSVPALAAYQALFVGLAGVLGGAGLAHDGANAVSK